jgi:hypothetical protein
MSEQHQRAGMPRRHWRRAAAPPILPNMRQRNPPWVSGAGERTPLRCDGFNGMSRLVSSRPLSTPTARFVRFSPLGWPVKPVSLTRVREGAGSATGTPHRSPQLSAVPAELRSDVPGRSSWPSAWGRLQTNRVDMLECGLLQRGGST